jgi:hypothetical protein
MVSALARLGGARVAADAGKAVGEDAAAEVGAEIVLDPLRDGFAVGIGRCGIGEDEYQGPTAPARPTGVASSFRASGRLPD